MSVGMMTAQAGVTESEEGADDVLGLLRRQAHLFARLEQFAARQRSLVRADDTGSLLSLLADRQKLSAELARLAGLLAPIRKGWASFREGLGDAQRLEAERLVSDAARCLQRVIESDEQDARLLSVKKQGVSDELGRFHAAGDALTAYAPRREWREPIFRLDETP